VEALGLKFVKQTSEVVPYNDQQVDSITTPTKGPSSILNGDKLKLSGNWNFNGLASKMTSNSVRTGRKVHKRNSRGRVKSLYVDNPKSILFKI